MRDTFGNLIDSEVGYARGKILGNSTSEKIKQSHAVNQIKKRIDKLGEDSLYIFTGNVRGYPIKKEDIGIYSEEWVGPSLYLDELRRLAIEHVSGNQETDDVFISNRTSAGLVSSILSFAKKDGNVLSIAPNNMCHPSVVRGTTLANANLISVSNLEELSLVDLTTIDLCILTSVTSELLYFEEEFIKKSIELVRKGNVITVVDDAYGARIRPILLKQKSARELQADLLITNNDKAGLHGPRAGIVVGDKKLVTMVASKASELGLEARAPVTLGVLRSLQNFEKEDLIEEKQIGDQLYSLISERLGKEYVRSTMLGPEISADNAMQIVVDKYNLNSSEIEIVPSEVTTAIGFILLNEYGIITTNTCGMPGARTSLRLKTNKSTLNSFGSVEKVVDAVLDAFNKLEEYIYDVKKIETLILGGTI